MNEDLIFSYKFSIIEVSTLNGSLKKMMKRLQDVEEKMKKLSEGNSQLTTTPSTISSSEESATTEPSTGN